VSKYSGALIVTTSQETAVAPPDTHGDPVSTLRITLVSKPEFLNGSPQLLRDHTGIDDVSIGKDDGQFVSTVPGSDITGTHIPNYGGSNHAGSYRLPDVRIDH